METVSVHARSGEQVRRTNSHGMPLWTSQCPVVGGLGRLRQGGTSRTQRGGVELEKRRCAADVLTSMSFRHQHSTAIDGVKLFRCTLDKFHS